MRHRLRVTKGNVSESAKFLSSCISSFRASLISIYTLSAQRDWGLNRVSELCDECLINFEENLIFVIEILAVILIVYQPITLSE
jgi:hypothetical protein